MSIQPNQKYHWEITSKQPVFSVNLRAVWEYRDLIMVMVKRDHVSSYQQTILGPVWLILQPLISALVFQLVFSKMAGLTTEHLPGPLFYLTGITVWNYFSDCLTKTASVLRDNAALFGKVYFPRIIIPISIAVSGLLKFFIQFLLCIIIMTYFLVQKQPLSPNFLLLTVPLVVIVSAAYGVGIGLILSTLTVKYRDLAYLISFLVQLLMYASPVIIPLSAVPSKFKWILNINPLTPLLQIFRAGFNAQGDISLQAILYGVGFSIITLITGIMIFNKVEKSFIDLV